MKIVEPGHIYELATLDGGDAVMLRFVRRFRGDRNHGGTFNQEVLRALIDRVQTLDVENPWHGNAEIIWHLRVALVLHEARALIRKAEKRDMLAECVEVDPSDGHFRLSLREPALPNSDIGITP